MFPQCLIFFCGQEVAGAIPVQHAKFAACTSAGYLAALLCYIVQWQFESKKLIRTHISLPTWHSLCSNCHSIVKDVGTRLQC